MREIHITEYCLDFIDKQEKRVSDKYRVMVFAIDHLNFSECTKAICLNGFGKKSNKDYLKAIKEAERLLEKYLKNQK